MTTRPNGSSEQAGQPRSEVVWGEPVDGVRLGISLRPAYAAGEPIPMAVFILNEGPEAVRVSESHFLVDHDAAVQTGEGAVVPWTAEGEAARRRARQAVWRRVIVTIEPLQQHEVTPVGRLDEWFHLAERGRYRVLITRPDWALEHGAPLRTSSSFDVTARLA